MSLPKLADCQLCGQFKEVLWVAPSYPLCLECYQKRRDSLNARLQAKEQSK